LRSVATCATRHGVTRDLILAIANDARRQSALLCDPQGDLACYGARAAERNR